MVSSCLDLYHSYDLVIDSVSTLQSFVRIPKFFPFELNLILKMNLHIDRETNGIVEVCSGHTKIITWGQRQGRSTI